MLGARSSIQALKAARPIASACLWPARRVMSIGSGRNFSGMAAASHRRTAQMVGRPVARESAHPDQSLCLSAIESGGKVPCLRISLLSPVGGFAGVPDPLADRREQAPAGQWTQAVQGRATTSITGGTGRRPMLPPRRLSRGDEMLQMCDIQDRGQMACAVVDWSVTGQPLVGPDEPVRHFPRVI
jgi:hypothetical protein